MAEKGKYAPGVNFRLGLTASEIVSAAVRCQKIVKRRALVVVLTDMYSHSMDGSLSKSIALWRQRHLPFVVGLVGEDIYRERTLLAKNELGAYRGLAAREYLRTVRPC